MTIRLYHQTRGRTRRFLCTLDAPTLTYLAHVLPRYTAGLLAGEKVIVKLVRHG